MPPARARKPGGDWRRPPPPAGPAEATWSAVMKHLTLLSLSGIGRAWPGPGPHPPSRKEQRLSPGAEQRLREEPAPPPPRPRMGACPPSHGRSRVSVSFQNSWMSRCHSKLICHTESQESFNWSRKDNQQTPALRWQRCKNYVTWAVMW